MDSINMAGLDRVRRCTALLWAHLVLVAAGVAAAPAAVPVTSENPVALLEGKALALDDATGPDVRLPMHWVSQCDTQKVQLEIRLTPLSNGLATGVAPTLTKDDRSAVKLKTEGQAIVTAEPIELGPRERLRLTLEARLLDAGSYRAWLQVTVLRTRGKPLRLDPVEVKIKRITSPPPVEFAAAPALLLPVPWFPWERSDQKSEVTLKVYTLGDTVVLAAPHLAAAARKNTVDATGDGEASSFALDEKLMPNTPFAVAPGGYASAPVVFKNIPGAGRYDAILRFASPGYKPAEAKVVIFARESFWVAVFFVFVGALLSWLIQLWGGVFKPWREFKQRLGALTESIHALGIPAAAKADELDRLLGAVMKNLQAAFSGNAAPLPWRQVARLESFEAVLPPLRLWAARWRELPQVAPDTVGERFRAALLNLTAPLGSSTPDSTQLREAMVALEAMPGQIRQAVADELEKAVTALELDLGNDARQALLPVRAQLRAVRARAQSRQLEAAVGLYQQTLRAYAKVMADELRARADRTQLEPQGVTAKEWQALCEETTRYLDEFELQGDPEQALVVLQDATAAYVQGIAQALQRAVQARSTEARKLVGDAAAKVNESVQKRNLVGAWQALDDVRRAYEEALSVDKQPMGLAAAAVLNRLTRALAGPSGLGTAFQLPGWWADAARPGAPQRIARQNLLLDIVVSLVVLLVSAFSTVQTFWTSNPVWGGWAACLAAVLAGFAADRFAHSAVSAFRKPDSTT